MLQLRALALVAASLAGCATTSGRDWLSSPIEERATPSSGEMVGVAEATSARPRLSHTVTLGETYAAALPATASAPGSPPVQVNVQTQVPVVVNHYGGGYGYGYGYGAAGYPLGVVAPVRAARGTSASQKVGADFPAIVDYGPRAMQ